MRTLLVAALAVLAVACAHPGTVRHTEPSPAMGPPLMAETLEGERIELGGPGPVRLVELWATWCEPCGPAAEQARPVLERHPGVRTYAVALDTDRKAVGRYVAEYGALGTPLVYPGGVAAAARRGHNRVPMFVALDTSGRVVGRIVGLAPGFGPALDRLLTRAEERSARDDRTASAD